MVGCRFGSLVVIPRAVTHCTADSRCELPRQERSSSGTAAERRLAAWSKQCRILGWRLHEHWNLRTAGCALLLVTRPVTALGLECWPWAGEPALRTEQPRTPQPNEVKRPSMDSYTLRTSWWACRQRIIFARDQLDKLEHVAAGEGSLTFLRG